MGELLLFKSWVSFYLKVTGFLKLTSQLFEDSLGNEVLVQRPLLLPRLSSLRFRLVPRFGKLFQGVIFFEHPVVERGVLGVEHRVLGPCDALLQQFPVDTGYNEDGLLVEPIIGRLVFLARVYRKES